MGGSLALKARKVLESSQKKSGDYSQCCTPWNYELRERHVSLPLSSTNNYLTVAIATCLNMVPLNLIGLMSCIISIKTVILYHVGRRCTF